MNRVSVLFVVFAALATVYATVTFLAGMTVDFETSAMSAIAMLLSALTLNEVERIRDRRIAAGRDAVWGRRERAAYGAAVPAYPDSIPLDGTPRRHLTVIDGVTVCISKVAPALSDGEVDDIRAAIRDIQRGAR